MFSKIMNEFTNANSDLRSGRFFGIKRKQQLVQVAEPIESMETMETSRVPIVHILTGNTGSTGSAKCEHDIEKGEKNKEEIDESIEKEKYIIEMERIEKEKVEQEKKENEEPYDVSDIV